MKSRTELTGRTPHDLLEEVRALVAEGKTMLGDSLVQHSEDAISALRLRFDAAQERLEEFYAGARKKVVDGAHCTDAAIRANPYQSIAIAAGVGLIIGVLACRRTR